MFYKTFWSFINSVCHDYIDRIWNRSKNVCGSYEILIIFLQREQNLFAQSIYSLY